MPTDSPLGDAMRARRARLGLSQRAAAEAAKIGLTTWHRIENGAQEPEQVTLSKLDQALRWKPGSATAVLRGGQPTPAESEPKLGQFDRRWVSYLREVAADPTAQVRIMREAGTWPEGMPHAGEPIVTDQMVEEWLDGRRQRPGYRVAAAIGDALGDRAAALAAAGMEEYDVSFPGQPFVRLITPDGELVVQLDDDKSPAEHEAKIREMRRLLDEAIRDVAVRKGAGQP